MSRTVCLVAALALLSSCLAEKVPTRALPGATADDQQTGGSGGGPTGNPATALPKVEIRHLVEPNITTADYPTYHTGTGLSGAGSYVRKLTLPKNYAGHLYLGGLNIRSLGASHVKVRFSFGASRDYVDIPATVTRAPGITPNTDIDVLMMDLRHKPFNRFRLIYDLYDYRDYSDPDAVPVDSNRDASLYCRALRLEDDHTFTGQGLCDGLAADGVTPLDEKCLYTYAKVVDRGLVKIDGATRTQVFPTLTQQDWSGSGYYNQTTSKLLNRCLPDKTVSVASPVTVVSGASAITGVPDLSFTAFGAAGVLGTQNVEYRGPFMAVNAANWEITGDAVFDPAGFGLFDSTPSWPATGTFAEKLDEMHLYRSKLFPRFGELALNAGVQYLATDFSALDTKTVTTTPGAGATELVDGCSLRVSNPNPNGEHIGSCTATAKIEVFATDSNDVEFLVAESKEVLLQLVRPTSISTAGTEYLFANFKHCATNSQCASGECCFNQRCWSDALVSQCLDDITPPDNLPVGVTCQNDLECSSFCCSSSTGRCAPHDTSIDPPVLCGKQDGEFCISKEWCKEHDVTECHVVWTGLTNDAGVPTCAKRCFPTKKNGDCRNGTCTPPPTPAFVAPPANPTDCANAIDLPQFES